MTDWILVVGDGEAADRAAAGLADVDGVSVLRAATAPEPRVLGGGGVDCTVVAPGGDDWRDLLDGRAPADPTVVLAGDDAAPGDGTPGHVDVVPPDDLERLVERVTSAVDGDAERTVGDEEVLPFRNLIDHNPAGIVLARDGEVRYANAAFAELLGRDRASLIGADPSSLVGDPDRSEDPFGADLGAGERRRGQFAVRPDEGTATDVEVHATRLPGGGRLATVVDVTERARRRETVTALHDATVELMGVRDPEAVAWLAVKTARDVLDLPHSGVFLWDDDEGALRPAATTTAARATIGEPPTFERGEGIAGHAFEREETVVLDDAQADPRGLDDGSEAIRSYCVVPMGEHGVLTVASTEEGELDDFDVQVTELLAAGAEVALDRIERERTLRERERTLQAERDRFSALFENVPEPAVHTVIRDGEPHVEDVNRAFEDVFGYDAEEIEGKPLADYVVPAGEGTTAGRLNEQVAAGEFLDVEVRRETAAGPRTFLLRFAPIEGEDGGYAIYTDITERKEHERELRRQNERLEQFASVVSHDLRNPLNVITGAAELARETGDPDRLDEVVETAARMDGLIDDLLTLARQGRIVGETEVVSLQGVAEAAWDHCETADATLTVRDDARLRADHDRLCELLENLYGNAVQHAGADVAVTVGPLADEADGDWGFYVADDGPGIPTEEHDRVFDRGYTTADDGTGFGLAIVDEIAGAHGWDVRVTDGEAGGARFEVAGVASG